MTNKEFREKIDRLEAELAEVKKMAEGMKKRADGGGAFKPEYKEAYWHIDSDGGVYSDLWKNYNFDKNLYSMGNCFPTKQAAEDTVRVLKLIQKARESQSGFAPDWDDETQNKYSLKLKFGNISIENCPLINRASTLGYWRDKSECDKFAKDNHDELIWFFTEYKR